MDAIVLKALARRPAERYASGDALADDLRRYLSGQTVLAHPPTMLYQLPKLGSRHRPAVAMGAVVTCSLLSIAVVSTTLREAFGLEHPHTLRAVRNLARFLVRRGRLQEAEALFAECVAATRSYYGDGTNLAGNLLQWGHTLGRLSRLDEAEQVLRTSVALFTSELGEAHPETRRSQLELVNVLTVRMKFDEAETMTLKAWGTAVAEPAAPGAQQLRIADAAVRLSSARSAAQPGAAWDHRAARWQATRDRLLHAPRRVPEDADP